MVDQNGGAMLGSEILARYRQIEYLATTDGKWYKLSDLFPFASLLEGDPEIVVLDTGGQSGDFGHFKIAGGKLLRELAYPFAEWHIVADIRFCTEPRKPYRNPGIIAVGKPFIITKRSQETEGKEEARRTL